MLYHIRGSNFSQVSVQINAGMNTLELLKITLFTMKMVDGFQADGERNMQNIEERRQFWLSGREYWITKDQVIEYAGVPEEYVDGFWETLLTKEQVKEECIKTIIKFTDNILRFQDVDDVLSGKIDEWLDMDREEWKKVIDASQRLESD